MLESRDCSSARSTLASSSSRLIGFSMKSDAPAFMACTAIGTSLLPVIMMAGSRWPASPKLPQQFDAVHARQIGIDHQTCLAAWSVGCKEFLASRVILDDTTVVLKHAANCLTYLAVVVDDEDGGLALGSPAVSMWRGKRTWAADCGTGMRR